MVEVGGIYDGEVVRLEKPVRAEANTRVVIMFPDASPDSPDAVFDLLEAQGFLQSRPPRVRPPRPVIEPIRIKGGAISDTVIEDRGSL